MRKYEEFLEPVLVPEVECHGVKREREKERK